MTTGVDTDRGNKLREKGGIKSRIKEGKGGNQTVPGVTNVTVLTCDIYIQFRCTTQSHTHIDHFPFTHAHTRKYTQTHTYTLTHTYIDTKI